MAVMCAQKCVSYERLKVIDHGNQLPFPLPASDLDFQRLRILHWTIGLTAFIPCQGVTSHTLAIP